MNRVRDEKETGGEREERVKERQRPEVESPDAHAKSQSVDPVTDDADHGRRCEAHAQALSLSLSMAAGE